MRQLICLLAFPAYLLAQISGAGNLGCNAATTTGTAWNSSTGSNATQTIATNSPFVQWVIVLNETTTLTAGAITVEGDYGDGNFVTVPSSNLFNATTLVQVSNPYTVQASTNVQWILTMGGMKTARIRLSTVITGSGTVTPFFTGLCTPVFPGAVYTSSLPTLNSGQGAQLQLDAKGQQLQDLNYIAGAAIDTNSGNKSAATQRVVLATDQPQLANKLLVTPDSVALPPNQSVNAAQINGITPLMGNGTTGTGSQRVTIASDNTAFTVNSAESGTWTVQPGNTPNTSAWLVQPVPGAANGLTNFVLEPAASDNHANVKNGAGVVYHVSATNNSATINYLRLYNAATGFNGCNSATNLLYETVIPASTSGAGVVDDFPLGITFGTGISICVTGAFGQTSTTNATASAIEINVGYK